jgi:hypothetical protein
VFRKEVIGLARVHVVPARATIGWGKAGGDFLVIEFSKTGMWKSSVICKGKTEARNTAIAIRNRIRREAKKRGRT